MAHTLANRGFKMVRQLLLCAVLFISCVVSSHPPTTASTTASSHSSAYANFMGVLHGGGGSGSGMDSDQARKLVDMVMEQFAGEKTINLLCYDGANWAGYCDRTMFSCLETEAIKRKKGFEVLKYDIRQHPSMFMEYLAPTGRGQARAHILTFSAGNTLKEMKNLHHGKLANGKSLVLLLQDFFSNPSSQLPVVFGSSAGAIVWFDGGISDSCGAWYRHGEYVMARVPGLGILPGFVCPHAQATVLRSGLTRGDLHLEARRKEAAWYTAVESGIQLNDGGAIWIQNGTVHHLKGNVKSFVGASSAGTDLPPGGTSLSKFLYGTGPAYGPRWSDLTLEDIPRDFRITNIDQNCYSGQTVSQGVDPSAFLSELRFYIRRFYSVPAFTATRAFLAAGTRSLNEDSQCVDFTGSHISKPAANPSAILTRCPEAAQWQYGPDGLIRWRNPNLDVGSNSIGSDSPDDWCLDVKSAEWNEGSSANGAGVTLWPCGDNVARWRFDKGTSKIFFSPERIPAKNYKHRDSAYCLDFKGSKQKQFDIIGKSGSEVFLWVCENSFFFASDLAGMLV